MPMYEGMELIDCTKMNRHAQEQSEIRIGQGGSGGAPGAETCKAATPWLPAGSKRDAPWLKEGIAQPGVVDEAGAGLKKGWRR